MKVNIVNIFLSLFFFCSKPRFCFYPLISTWLNPYLCGVQKLSLQNLNRLSTEEFRQAAKIPCIAVLDNVRSMHNVGSVFRTADAFRLEKIVLCGITGCPPHREITKTAIGADKSVLWEYSPSALEIALLLKKEGYTIAAVEQAVKSTPLHEIFWGEKPHVFVFGNEIDGISQEVLEICDLCIEIPQAGTKHSLNISVAAGIVLWEFAKGYLPLLPSSA
ncbi:MAG: RNA methyltransferase [Bacteroidetes bacterium]|nr:RNA methyltransferase [Bacteroidota bacterium]